MVIMQIIEVKDGTTEKDFLEVPRIIYKNDKNWIPHLKQDIQKVFDPIKNKKMFDNGVVTRWILKDDNGNLIGRNAAFVNNKLANTFKQPTGGIGFFECIDNQEAADLLFTTAVDWLKAKGMDAMDGPINFGEKDQFWGLLTDNFTDMSSYGMNYNLPYYQALFENFGFKTYYEQFVYKRDLHVPAQPIFVRKYNQMQKDPKYSITNIRGKSLSQVAKDFREVYNGGWIDHDNFKPMTEETAQKIMKTMKPVIDRDIIIFVYYDNKPIAFYVNLPELNEIFQYVNGDLNWIGKLKFLYHKWKKTPEMMVGVVFGIVKEFQGKGIEGAMIKWTEDNVMPLNRYHNTIMNWIGDFNPKMLRVCEMLGADKYRTLITYRYLFDREAEFERAPIIE
jgi:hypothetical protein